jgi:hypothetical protein
MTGIGRPATSVFEAASAPNTIAAIAETTGAVAAPSKKYA